MRSSAARSIARGSFRNARARFESVKTRVGVARGTRTNAPFTSKPRRCPPSPFPPPRRSAPSRYVARSRSRRAREPGPPRREKRRRSDAEFSWRVRPGEQRERTGRPAPARTRSARCFRARGIDRTRVRPRRGGSPGSTSTDTHRRSASRDSTLTLLSGFERSTLFDAPRSPLLASRLTVRSLPLHKKPNSSRRARPPWRAAAAPSRRTRRST